MPIPCKMPSIFGPTPEIIFKSSGCFGFLILAGPASTFLTVLVDLEDLAAALVAALVGVLVVVLAGALAVDLTDDLAGDLAAVFPVDDEDFFVFGV